MSTAGGSKSPRGSAIALVLFALMIVLALVLPVPAWALDVLFAFDFHYQGTTTRWWRRRSG